MPTLLIVVLVGLLGGLAVGVQSPLASLIANRLGTLESVFIMHLGGAILAGALLLPHRGGNLGQWRSLPWYAVVAGSLGLVVISAVSYAIPRAGVVATTFLFVAGQMIMATLVDHFGLLDVAVRPLEPSRIVGIGVLMVGVWLIVR
jgi:transporter family-2 protein